VSQAKYQQIAADLRDAIASGEFPQGSTLPRIADLMSRYSVARQTIREAIGVLETEGLVEAIRRRGTVVRARPDRHRIVRHRAANRDELGYLFSSDSSDWREIRPSVVEYRPAPEDIARLLELPAGADVLVRDRLLGDLNRSERRQATTSYLPADLARGTALELPRTGPGGIYDRLEQDLGYGPLKWAEELSSQAATPADVAELALPPGVPVLRIVRISTAPSGRVVEVNDTHVSAELYVVRYPISRTRAARWPVSPAQAHPTDPGTPTTSGIDRNHPGREEAPGTGGPTSPQK
jgi:DNA-binding GntR family transcriptional regulator